MKENRVCFLAGLAGGFGFYIAWMVVSMIWQTATTSDAMIKNILGFAMGLVVGVLLYIGVLFLANNKRKATISKRINRFTAWGMAAGLLVAFLVGMLFYNPTGLWPEPLFPVKPIFPLD